MVRSYFPTIGVSTPRSTLPKQQLAADVGVRTSPIAHGTHGRRRRPDGPLSHSRDGAGLVVFVNPAVGGG